MKYKHVIWIVVLVLVADQALKFWVKTHMTMDQEFMVIGNWFRIHFLENPGMAYGLEFGGNFGKILLTLFRLVAVILGFGLMKKLVRENYSNGLLVFGALILAGAAGNLIDSMFYGLIFTDSNYYQVAQFMPNGGGYGHFLYGRVVDMLYFHLYDDTLPNWVPFSGGRHFIFFAPIFNIADASISVGVIAILLFQKKLLHKKTAPVVTGDATINTASEHTA